MIMAEFYRQKIVKLNRAIRDAEYDRDFKKVAKLESEKAEAKIKIKELENK